MSLVNAPVLGINLKKNARPPTLLVMVRYYPEVARQKTLTTRGFAEHMISHGSKYGLEDIVAILRMFSTCLPELLAMGIGVKFDGLGCFLPYAQSKKGITKAEMAGITPLKSSRPSTSASSPTPPSWITWQVLPSQTAAQWRCRMWSSSTVSRTPRPTRSRRCCAPRSPSTPS